MFFKNISALVIFSCHKTSEFSKIAAFGWKNTCRFFAYFVALACKIWENNFFVNFVVLLLPRT